MKIKIVLMLLFCHRLIEAHTVSQIYQIGNTELKAWDMKCRKLMWELLQDAYINEQLTEYKVRDCYLGLYYTYEAATGSSVAKPILDYRILFHENMYAICGSDSWQFQFGAHLHPFHLPAGFVKELFGTYKELQLYLSLFNENDSISERGFEKRIKVFSSSIAIQTVSALEKAEFTAIDHWGRSQTDTSFRKSLYFDKTSSWSFIHPNDCQAHEQISYHRVDTNKLKNNEELLSDLGFKLGIDEGLIHRKNLCFRNICIRENDLQFLKPEEIRFLNILFVACISIRAET